MGQGGRALRRSDRPLHEPERLGRTPALDAPPRQLQTGDDPGKHVVEVMGDAARQLPHRLHLLALPQLLLELPAIRDVSTRGVERIAFGHEGPIDLPPRVFGVTQPEVDMLGRRLRCERPGGEQAIFGMNELGERVTQQSILPVTQERRPRRIYGAQCPVAPNHGDQVEGKIPNAVPLAGALLHAGFERPRQLLKLLFGALRIGNVVNHADETRATNDVVGAALAAPGDPTFFAGVGAPNAELTRPAELRAIEIGALR